MIAAAIAALGFAGAASAQKDAAEKAQEGSIEHWIEYYKGERRKPAAPSPPAAVAAPVEKHTEMTKDAFTAGDAEEKR